MFKENLPQHVDYKKIIFKSGQVWNTLSSSTYFFSVIALFGIFLVRYGKWFLRLEQVENAPKFPRPSEGGNKFTNGFQNLTNKHPFSSCSLLLAVLVLERKVIPNTANDEDTIFIRTKNIIMQ